jgi:hypothetical protein
VHVDLHETTDSDETEFLPAMSARDGKATHTDEGVPDGFYLAARPTPFTAVSKGHVSVAVVLCATPFFLLACIGKEKYYYKYTLLLYIEQKGSFAIFLLCATALLPNEDQSCTCC